MNKKEFNKLRNNIATKIIIKIIIAVIIEMLIVWISVDIIFNDFLAEALYNINRDWYYFCIINKSDLALILLILFAIISSYVFFRGSNKNILEIIDGMDGVMENPERNIKLSNNLVVFENRLNEIRVNLLKNRNKAVEENIKKNDLIMYMAHDLKTPLTSVIGYLNLLKDEKDISDNLQAKYIGIALEKSLRLEELTNQFFEITRYNSQELIVNKTNINLSFLIDQILDEFYPTLQEKRIGIVVNKPECIQMYLDGDKIARAFTNLIKNAITYTYEETDIEIELEEKENNIKCVFKNRADEIPQYKLDKLFDKFYRVDESRNTNTGNSGVGLAITKEIVELHGGKIYVESDSKYIKFTIELYK